MEENTIKLDPMDELDILAGPYLEPYWDDFVKFEQEVRHVRAWSWGAFFFGFFWFMARRLYSLAFLGLTLIVIFLFVSYLMDSAVLFCLLYPVWMLWRGAYGKYMFWQSLKDRALYSASETGNSSPDEYEEMLRKKAITDSSVLWCYTASVVLALVAAGLFYLLVYRS